MRQFAELNQGDDNTIKAVFSWDVPGHDPVYEPSFKQPIEITALDPQPAVGWLYDPSTGMFALPA